MKNKKCRSVIRIGSMIFLQMLLTRHVWCVEQPAVAVSLSATRAAYVLGQPVQFEVVVKNATAQPIKHWNIFVQRAEPEIQIFIAGEGKAFKEYRMGIYAIPKISRKTEELKPGESRKYEFHILYAFQHPSRLAFDRSGKYRVKARFPLITPQPIDRTEFESNVISLRIEEPMGKDAEAWKVVQDPEFLYFMQSGFVEKKDPEVPAKAARLLLEFPESGYQSALRWALKEHRTRNGDQISAEDSELIDRALATPGPALPPAEKPNEK